MSITGFQPPPVLPLQLGAKDEFPISDGNTTIVHASVDKREQIKVLAGSFPAVLVTAEATSGAPQSRVRCGYGFGGSKRHSGANARQAGMGTLLFRLQRIEKVNLFRGTDLLWFSVYC